MENSLLKILISIITISTASCRFAEDETYILPNNYTGPVIILFNQSNGKSEKYNNGKRIYEVNKNGILKTQFKFQEGFRDIEYKYYNGKAIRYLWPSDVVWHDTFNLNNKYKDSVYVYSAYNSDHQWFSVGKAKDVNLNHKLLEEKWDSLMHKK